MNKIFMLIVILMLFIPLVAKHRTEVFLSGISDESFKLEMQKKLMSCQASIVGYNRFNLIRES